MSSVLYPIMFLLAIGYGLGSQVDDTSSLGTDDYVSFVGPGVMAAVAMVQAGGLSLWPTLGAIKWEGDYRAALATPLTSTELATGHVLWIGFRSLVAATVYTTVLVVFGVADSFLAVLAPAAAALTALAFAAPISAWSASRESDGTFSVINRAGITPMFLFSGAFFPVEQLPDSVEWVSRIVPVWHGVSLTRGLVNGSLDLWPAIGHAAYLMLWFGLGLVACVRVFTRRLAG